MTSTLMDYFNRAPRIGVLGTADRDGKVDVAVFGSPMMTDEETVIVAMAPNRTMANLRENPHAVYVIVEPGEGGMMMGWQGVRVYLELQRLETSGPALEEYRKGMARVVGEEAAGFIQALATFRIAEVRPIVDMGQGWDGPS